MNRLAELATDVLGIFVDVISFIGIAFSVGFVVMYINGITPYITVSGSMEPEIQTGSLCFVDIKTYYDEIETGDVIAFENFVGNMVMHRVVSVTEDGLETKGDANNVSDGVTVTETNFRGKTLFSIPYAGYVLDFLKQSCRKVIALLALSFINIIRS